MLSTLARPRARGYQAQVSWSPLDARWYQQIGGSLSDAGLAVLPDRALTIAVVYRAVNVLAHSVASIPLVIYRTSDAGKERAKDHPQYRLLHDQPNAWSTSFRWRHLMMVQAILWGKHVSEIVPGPGAVGQLVPLSPDTTRIVDQLSDGRLVYVTRDVTAKGFGPERRLLQDDVLHIRGFSLDGKEGIPLTTTARNAMGLALAAEKHGSMFLRRGATFAGFLTTDAAMDEQVRKENEAAWARGRSGPDGSGRTPLLTGGIKYQPISSTNKDSQWLESRTFEVEELLRFLGVPGVLCGYADKTATYASAEQFFLSFVTHTVRPWTENIATELNFSVVTGAPDAFADFVLEGLLRGDIKTRYDSYQSAIAAGWMNRNEARERENLNRGPDDLDEFLSPLNMQSASRGSLPNGPAAQPQRAPAADPGDAGDAADPADAEAAALRGRLHALTRRTAERLVRKEVAAIAGGGGKMGAAKRYANDASGWRAWVERFYTEHAEAIAADLGLTVRAVRDYCGHQTMLLTSGQPWADHFEADSLALLLAFTDLPTE